MFYINPQNSQHQTSQEPYGQCDPNDIRTHDWIVWTIYFMKCHYCGEYTARDSFQQKVRQMEETDRSEAQWGR